VEWVTSRTTDGVSGCNHASTGARIIPAHEVELLRAGEPEVTSSLPGVDRHLDEGRQLRRILDLVDQQRRGKPTQEQRRLVSGKGRHDGVVERDVVASVPREVTQETGLADLPGTGHEHHGKVSA